MFMSKQWLLTSYIILLNNCKYNYYSSVYILLPLKSFFIDGIDFLQSSIKASAQWLPGSGLCVFSGKGF